jgi:hypothetical protein
MFYIALDWRKQVKKRGFIGDDMDYIPLFMTFLAMLTVGLLSFTLADALRGL